MWEKCKILRGVMALLAALTSLASGKVPQEGIDIKTYSAVAETGYCTVLVYMNGSDLESDYGCAAADLEEMADALSKIDSKKEIRVVVEAGGTTQWKYEPMIYNTYGRFCLTKDMDEVKVEKLEARNMGRSDTLADFLNYGTGAYPAKHYGLICWNHGEGQIQGFGCDSNFNDDSLTLAEIRDAFENSVIKEPLDFVSMDACLMGNVELAAVLEGKTKYLIGSEDLEPKEGHDYCWMEELAVSDVPEPYGKQIGDAIITSYQNSVKEVDHGLTVCLSLIDLNAFGMFHELFDEMIGGVNSSFATTEDKKLFFQELGKQRQQMLGFYHKDQRILPEQVDLMDFVQTIEKISKKLCPEADTAVDKTEEIEKVYEQLVIRSFFQGYQKTPCGLSIYLPGGAGKETEQEISVYQKIRFCGIYNGFVEEYADFLKQENQYNWNAPQIQGNQLIFPLNKDEMNHIANAYAAVIYCREDGNSFFLFADGDVSLDRRGYLHATEEIDLWGIKGQALSMIEVYDLGYLTEYMARVLYKENEDDQWKHCTMYIDFSDEEPDGEIRDIIPVDIEKQIYTLKEGDQLIPLYPLYRIDDEKENAEDSDPKIYDNSYYMGERIIIENLSAGDDRLEMIYDLDKDRLAYGFLIRDDHMNLYCSDTVNLNKNKKIKEDTTWER